MQLFDIIKFDIKFINLIVPNNLMFIRIKKRGSSGNYAYLVENFWTKGSSRQRIKSYLGKVHYAEKVHDVQVNPNFDLDYKNVILNLVKNELFRHGFKEKEGVYCFGKVFVNLNLGTIYDSKGKNVVIKLNEGYLCDYHLQQLFELRVNEDERIKGIELANLLVSSGLKVNPEGFVELYKKLPEQEKDEIIEETKKELLNKNIGTSEENVGNGEDFIVDEFGLERNVNLGNENK